MHPRSTLNLAAFAILLLGVGPASPQLVGGVLNGRASAGSATSSSSEANSTAPSRTVRGQVSNGLTGVPIPRALVSINARQVLTDLQGRFEFPQFTDEHASVRATKPGYSPTSDANDMFVQGAITDLDAPVEVKLYPNAVVTGFVSGPDSQPLPQIQVILRRTSNDGAGPRWFNAGNATTNSHGEYRISAPAGRYRVVLGYRPRVQDTGEALLPESFPMDTASAKFSSFAVVAGEEKHIDLRPRMGRTFPVLIRVDFARGDPGDQRPNLQFTAIPLAGEAFNLGFSIDSNSGEYKLELPSGTYTLRAHSESREEAMEGASHVTVSGHPVSGLTLHLAPVASLPIQVDVDPASAPQNVPTRGSIQLGIPSAQVPNAQMLNLVLHNLGNDGNGMNRDAVLRPREDKTFEFRAPPGRYRLQGNGGGNWYVESATYGGATNLLTSDIFIADGSGGSPIRIVASNQRGTVHGFVNLPSTASGAWVYFFPRTPRLTPPNPSPAGSGTTFYATLPVGSYSVVAFSTRVFEDLRDPEVIARLTGSARTVEVTAGADIAIQLDIAQPKEADH